MDNGKTAIVLGSGLHQIVNDIVVHEEISYDQIEGFKPCQVKGHQGKMIVGELESQPVICCLGRPHWYEGRAPEEFLAFVRMLKNLGATSLIVTHCSGSLNPDFRAGAMMLVKDHINWQFKSPLIGIQEEVRSRFLNMDNVYDLDMRKELKASAGSIGLDLEEGVYMGVQGPCFETPAEVKAFQMLGADTVAMSSIPEIIAARYYELKVAMISVVVNQGSGLSDEVLSHEHTLKMAANSDVHLAQLFRTYFGRKTVDN